MDTETPSAARCPLPEGGRRNAARIFTFLAGAVLATACSRPQPAVTPPDAKIVSAEHCAEMRKLLTDYPETMVEREPERLRAKMPTIAPARRDTAFTVGFVVNTVGKPVPSTMTISKHVGARFTAAMKTSIASWTYRPALHRGCPVPRKVSHTIDVSKTRAP